MASEIYQEIFCSEHEFDLILKTWGWIDLIISNSFLQGWEVDKKLLRDEKTLEECIYPVIMAIKLQNEIELQEETSQTTDRGAELIDGVEAVGDQSREYHDAILGSSNLLSSQQ